MVMSSIEKNGLRGAGSSVCLLLYTGWWQKVSPGGTGECHLVASWGD